MNHGVSCLIQGSKTKRWQIHFLNSVDEANFFLFKSDLCQRMEDGPKTLKFPRTVGVSVAGFLVRTRYVQKYSTWRKKQICREFTTVWQIFPWFCKRGPRKKSGDLDKTGEPGENLQSLLSSN